MTSADPFTAACPLFRNAQRQCANTGAALQVSKGTWFSWPRWFK